MKNRLNAKIRKVNCEQKFEFNIFSIFCSEGDLACKLMKVDQDAFIKALLKPRVKVGTEWVNQGQNLEQVREQLVIKYGLFY